MERPPQSLSERIEEILRAVEAESGQRATYDRYPCLLRVGDDWQSYPFSWEPFRDLAGPLNWPEDAPPILVLSSKEALPEPLMGTFSEPHPYLRMRVSPATPLTAVVERWILQLSGYLPPLSKPNDWFLKNLQLEPAQVSAAVRQFLGLEQPGDAKPAGMSATVQGVAEELGSSQVSAFAIFETLKQRHPEYASHRLGQATLEVPPEAASHEWEVWRDSVAQLYDEGAVAKSHHQVIDGRLLLVGLGLFEKPLREALEKADLWAALLLEIDEAVVKPSGPLRDALNAIQLAHGYRSDRAEGDDHLGIRGEVNALCEVIMDPKVAPPLAVGLFGTWGSGKSFFMEKMRERVHELTSAKAENRPKNVVQIRFNAWHYADTSLWASLAVEIFERLADPEPVLPEEREKWLHGRGDPKRKEREQLLTNLETYREARAALEKECEHLETEKRRLEKEREQAEEKRRNDIEQSSLTMVAAELARDDEVKKGLENISRELGLKPAVDQLNVISRELQSASGYLTATWRKIEDKRWTVGLLAAALVLLVLTLGGSLSGYASWLGGLIPGLGSLASMMLAASKHILPAAQTVNRALAQVSATIERVSQLEEELAAKRSREEQELELRLAQHNEQIAAATRGIAALDEKIAGIAAQADALTVGRRLYDFLADRAAGYQKHQGVIGMLHRDFRLLDAQLRAQSSAAEIAGLPRIDRVVLYIDDLDRCSPAKVLEVLEAVHLLLALELFIVVVGVDPRWLQRSLRHQYRSLCLSEDPSRDPYLQAMPTEYLEKIFQIPLTLPAMEAKAYGALISSLAPGTALPAPAPPPENPSTTTRRASSPDSPGGDRAPTRALLQVQEGSAAQGRGGTSIDLTSEEVGFVQQLGGLVHTPRAAKRLMNTYRLIRATQHVGSRSRFLGADGNPGEYYAVLTLLAIAAGYPTLADRVLVALEDDAQKLQIGKWADFLDGLEPGKGKLLPADIFSEKQEDGLVYPKQDDLLSQTAAAEWENMFLGLMGSLALNRLEGLEPYQRWGRTVARFSFTL